MYDYLSIRSDSKYSKKVTIEKFVTLIQSELDLKQESSATFSFCLNDIKFLVQGIFSDSRGCYAFNSDSEFKKINLLEINIPQGSESIYEQEILEVAQKIASLLGWEIYDDELGKTL